MCHAYESCGRVSARQAFDPSVNKKTAPVCLLAEILKPFIVIYNFLSVLVMKGPAEVRGVSSPCERGHYCTNGIKRPCPAGRFGSSAQETSSLSSDFCPAGFFCPEGSARLVSSRGCDKCPDGEQVACRLHTSWGTLQHDVPLTYLQDESVVFYGFGEDSSPTRAYIDLIEIKQRLPPRKATSTAFCRTFSQAFLCLI